MTPRLIVVRKCSECPAWDDHIDWCNLDDDKRETPDGGNSRPDWCPLRAGDVVLRGEEDA